MSNTPASGPSYNVALMRDDMAEKGWLATDVARRARISDMTVSRFLSGQHRTARTAKKIACALGFKIGRYLVRSSATAQRGAMA